MPEIQVRAVQAADLPHLTALEHNYTSDRVWQVDVQSGEGQVNVIFRETRLPRSVRVEYPHPATKLEENWQQRDGLLVANIADLVVGYISLRLDMTPSTAWVEDVIVLRRMRQQGIGGALILAGQNWAAQRGCRRMVLEIQSKNYPAISLAQKMGFDFSGYHERYFSNMDIALFFSKVIA